MRVKKCLSMLLAVIMIGTMITSLPITASAVDIHTAAIGEGTVFYVDTAEKLNAACDRINEKGGTYTIDLTGSFEGQVEITNKDAVVTVISSTGETLTNLRTAVCVENGATVKLGGNGNTKLTLQGNDQPHNTGEGNDDPGLIYILPGSTCEMNENVTLKDRKGNNYLGGGVTVQGGSFIMNGGTIENCGIDGGSVCYGGGVAVVAGGLFKMNSGVIKNCYVTSSAKDGKDPSRCFTAMGGGVFVSGGSSFIMNGGTISDNTATNFGGGVAMALSNAELRDIKNNYGDIDLGNPHSMVEINNSVISHNKAKSGAGVFASGYYYAYFGIFRIDPLEVGEPDTPGLNINNSEISSNEADEIGGGVLVTSLRSPRKAQIKNTSILNNTAAKGAGVMNYSYWTNFDIDSCTISRNKASSNGGGLMAVGNSDEGYTAIKDTTINNNVSGDRGAGVYYDVESEIRVSGADIIQDNKFNGKKNNLNVLSLKKPVTVAGDLTGSKIGLSDPTLWDDGKEDFAADAVSTLRLTDGYKTNNDSINPANVFTSDHDSWYVDYGDKYESEKTVYKYTAKKYDNTLGLSEGYDVNTRDNGDVFIKVPATQFSGYTEDTTDLYNELCYLYEKNNRYSYVSDFMLYGYLPDYPGKIYYDTIIKTYVAVLKMNNSGVYVIVSQESSTFENLEGDHLIFFASNNVQRFLNNEENTLGLKIGYYYDESDIPGLFNDYTEVELEYEKPLDFGNSETKTIYKINEYGYATTKYVIEKNSEYNDGSYDYTNEVRLVRRKPEYHINNEDIDDNYDNNDIFTSYIEAKTGEVKVGDTIKECYTIPEVKADKNNSCPYIFKGWYYDQENDNDTHPVKFGTDKYAKDIYAHWIKVDDVDKDAEDTNKLPAGYTKYGGFDLCGVQVRKERTIDTNFGGESMPGGLRFVTSLSKDVVNKINAIKPNNIEYGYVATNQYKEGWINYHNNSGRKLQYVSDGANGIDTSSESATDENYFGFATNVVCTSKQSNGTGGVVREDHRSYGDYLLYTLVVTYEGDDGTGYDKNVLARPYIRYTDANGLDRVTYSEYRGNSNTLGGCYTSYNKTRNRR